MALNSIETGRMSPEEIARQDALRQKKEVAGEFLDDKESMGVVRKFTTQAERFEKAKQAEDTGITNPKGVSKGPEILLKLSDRSQDFVDSFARTQTPAEAKALMNKAFQEMQASRIPPDEANAVIEAGQERYKALEEESLDKELPLAA